MTTTPTPVERARERLARAVADDLYGTSVTGSVYDVTVLRAGETFRDLAERIGSIAADSLDVALAAALSDVEGIARVLCDADRETLDYERCRPDYVGDDPAVAYRPHAAALIEYLTGGAR